MALAPVKLPRLPTNWKDQPLLLENYWNQAMNSIEKTLNAIIEIPELQAAIVAAQDAANAANAAADNAQSVADTTTAATNIANSYVTGLTLTAADAGSDTTITISSHTRVYGDGTSVSVTGGVLTGKAYNTQYYIYYDQPSRTGGTVTYLTTTTASTAAQTGDRHVVGSVTTPVALDPPSDGLPVLPPGSGTIPAAF